MHPAEKNSFFQIDEGFPFQEYQSKLKENMFLDSKFSFDFEKILGQITDFKNSIMQINSPKKATDNLKKEETQGRNSQGKKENNGRKEEINGKKSDNINKKDENSAKKEVNSNKKEENSAKKDEKEEIPRKNEEISKNTNDNPNKKTGNKQRTTISSPKDSVAKKQPSREIKKYLTPTKERLKNSNMFIDDTFVDPQMENEVANFEKNTMVMQNHKSLSAKNADGKVIMFMAGNEKWARINEANSDKKPLKKASKAIANSKKPTKNGISNKKTDKDPLKKFDKNPRNSDIFQEKISEIQFAGNETSECMTPVKLLKELAQLKNLALEKSLTSDFGSRESFILKNNAAEDEKAMIKMSNKLKEKFKQDYNLDIDLIEKESRNSAMQTPSFGANNALQVLRHAKNTEKIQGNGEKGNEKMKKMEQINEINSPKEEKYGHYEFVEKVYQPILKKNGKK